MTNPMINPQPNYSGVTIQISNPTVNTCPQVNEYGKFSYGNIPPEIAVKSGAYASSPQTCYCTSPIDKQSDFQQDLTKSTQNEMQASDFPPTYPAEYYMNNYNASSNPADQKNAKLATDNNNGLSNSNTKATAEENQKEQYDNNFSSQRNSDAESITKYNNSENEQSRRTSRVNNYEYAADSSAPKKEEDLSTSNGIMDALEARQAKMEEEKKNVKETKIVALTDEYIKSLENYLNNPNDEIRLMASKEILTRLDEDKDRFDDAALNALLNKMLQDPSKLVRIAALSAFASQLASGNDYTVQLLQNIQSNPNADKEDVLQAADILLKMTAGTEIKNIPNPANKVNE